MTLQFILANGAIDHQPTLIDIATKWLQADNEHQVFFLVPNYNKFEREIELLQGMKHANQAQTFSSVRTQVFSFQRLAWYYLQGSDRVQQETITEIGARMLMQKVLHEHQTELLLFRGEIAKLGFVQQMLELYNEFQQGGVTTSVIPSLLEETKQTGNQKELATKLHELSLIFTWYEEALCAKDIQVAQPIMELTNWLRSEQFMENDQAKTAKTLYIVTGFSSFLAQERELLLTLMQVGELKLNLVAEGIKKNQTPLDLFYSSYQIYEQLIAAARLTKTQVLLDYTIQTPKYETGRQELEAYWQATQNQQQLPTSQRLAEFLTIWQVDTPQEELRQVAREIKRLVNGEITSQHPYTYKDIQVLILDNATYFPFLPAIFNEAHIPFYLDEQKKMVQHPLVQFIEVLVDLETYHYRLTDIIRLLRTELYIPPFIRTADASGLQSLEQFQQLVDITENTALAHNFQGAAWLSPHDWTVYSFDFEEEQPVETTYVTTITNQIRRAFREDIYSFLQRLKKATTYLEATKLFYQFLVAGGVETQLIQWRDQAMAQGNLESARNHEQTWAALMDCFDEFVKVYADTPFDWQLFLEMLLHGLQNVAFGKIPSAIDQVQINRLDLARPNQAKITFALGLSENAFPRKAENKTLLDVKERETINQQLGTVGYLKNQAQEVSQKEPFVAYSVFLSGTDHVYLSYAASSEKDQLIKPSPYIRRILEWSQQKPEHKGLITPMSDPSDYVVSYRGLIRQISQLERQQKQTKFALPTIWRQLKEKVLESSLHHLAQRVFASRDFQNEPVQLTRTQAESLYGTQVYSSVSRLETFYQCEYRYFTQYGLKLKERAIYGLTPAVTGEFFHDALDRFLRVLIKENLNLTQLTPETRHYFMEEVLKEIFGDARYKILQSSARMTFIYDQLSKTIQRVAWALQEQSQRMQLSPLQTEVMFGQIAANKGVPGLEIPLKNGGQLHVRGKIDRIDQVTIEDQTYLSVIDYKSSNHDFVPTDAYFGLAMQLITYLDVALSDAVELVGKTNVKAGGAFYLHVHNPELEMSEQLTEERLKKFKYSGLFIQDEALFPAYDETLEKSKNSVIFPVRMNKDEQYQMVSQSKDKFYTQDQLKVMIGHNRAKMKKGAETLLDGEIHLNPALKLTTQQRACQHCPFRSICAFDPMLPENNYHKIEPLDKQEILRRMEEERND